MNLDQISFENKTALIRVDFNVPLNEKLEVTDTTRIQAAKDTIIHVLEYGGDVVLMSHLGRPDGTVQDKYSLKHIVDTVSDILGVQVQFIAESTGEAVKEKAKNCKQARF